MAALGRDLEAGHRPVSINATAGTTVAGAFDPIAEIADVAAAHGVGTTAVFVHARAHVIRRRCHIRDIIVRPAPYQDGAPRFRRGDCLGSNHNLRMRARAFQRAAADSLLEQPFWT